MTIPAPVQNVACAVMILVYVKAVIALSGYLASNGWLDIRIGRKIVHMCAGSYIMFWPLFRPEHWTWRLNVLIYMVYAVSMFVKGAIIRDPNDPDVVGMSRTGNPTELLYGPFHFASVACFVGIYGFNKEEGVLIFSCLGFGDGLAPIVGMLCPFGLYPTFPFNTPARKSLSGSLGFFFGSILGYCILRIIVLGSVNDLSNIIPVAAVSAITEGLSGDFDNLTVTAAAFFMARYVVDR